MSDGSTIIKRAQIAVRQEMDRRGISLKVVAADAGIPYATLASYLPADRLAEPAQIPGGAIYSLAAGNALPSDLLSLLVPDGWAIIRAPEGVNHDELADAMADYLHTKNAAHHPESPAGREISDCERAMLDGKVVHLPLAGKVAA